MHEIMHKFGNLNTKIAWKATKLDIEKLYDRMEWDFILKCLQEMVFHPIWNAGIRECISSVSYSLIFNQEPNDLVEPTRGIKQGDQLLIFVFCIWKLSTVCYRWKPITIYQG